VRHDLVNLVSREVFGRQRIDIVDLPALFQGMRSINDASLSVHAVAAMMV
jgi:hypothetical protein